jgi:CYTH domain-containing protein
MRVDVALLPDLSDTPFDVIEDRYLDGGRLRLRKVTTPEGRVTYKLGKKYGPTGDHTEPITNIYLTEAEYECLRTLPGHDLTKRRYRFPLGERTFSVDAHQGKLVGLFLCEWEAKSVVELLATIPPPFCAEDVTTDERYSGAQLARADAAPD